MGSGELDNPFYWSGVMESLHGIEYNAPKLKLAESRALVLGWALAHYDFDKYRENKIKTKKLCGVDSGIIKYASTIAQGIFLTRDLINIPANDMNPQTMELASKQLSKEFNASFKVHNGKKIETEFPLIHAVGKASAIPPRLIEFNWGKSSNPTLTLIGKGITFDSGGLDLKPSAGMLNMKKDMGGLVIYWDWRILLWRINYQYA